MKYQALFLLILLASLLLIPAGAAGATGPAANTDSLPGIILSTALANLSIAVIAILILIGGLYAYASLARFAPYHSWIYLYLVSLTGIAWAAFLLVNGLPLADSVFILTTVIGLNLIVHILRFDRIQLSTTGQGMSAGTPPEQSSQDNDPLLFWNPPRF